MKIEQLKPKTLSESAYESIKGFILKNELLPGQSFSINSMAKALGISPTPVREAVAKLDAEGFLEGEPHKKLRVATIGEDSVRQVYNVRRLLEPHAAGLTARIAAKDDICLKQLKIVEKNAIHVLQKHSVQDVLEDYLQIDFQLNEIFLNNVDPFFRSVLEFVGERSLRIRTFAEAASKSKPAAMIALVTEEHIEIIKALMSGDEERAAADVWNHLINSELRTLEATKKKLQS